MPTPTYTHLASFTLTTDTSLIFFTSIPSTANGVALKDLVLVSQARSARNAATSEMYCYPNNSASVVNSWVRASGNGTTASYNIQAATDFLRLAQIPANTATAGAFGVSIVQFMDYTGSKHKTVLMRSNDPTSVVEMAAGTWASTSVLSSLAIYNTSAENFKAGSTFSLYGIAS